MSHPQTERRADFLRPGGAVYVQPRPSLDLLRFGFELAGSSRRDRMMSGLRVLRDLTRASRDLFDLAERVRHWVPAQRSDERLRYHKQFEELCADAALLRDEGFEPEVLEPEEARRREPDSPRRCRRRGLLGRGCALRPRAVRRRGGAGRRTAGRAGAVRRSRDRVRPRPTRDYQGGANECGDISAADGRACGRLVDAGACASGGDADAAPAGEGLPRPARRRRTAAPASPHLPGVGVCGHPARRRGCVWPGRWSSWG